MGAGVVLAWISGRAGVVYGRVRMGLSGGEACGSRSWSDVARVVGRRQRSGTVEVVLRLNLGACGSSRPLYALCAQVVWRARTVGAVAGWSRCRVRWHQMRCAAAVVES